MRIAMNDKSGCDTNNLEALSIHVVINVVKDAVIKTSQSDAWCPKIGTTNATVIANKHDCIVEPISLSLW